MTEPMSRILVKWAWMYGLLPARDETQQAFALRLAKEIRTVGGRNADHNLAAIDLWLPEAVAQVLERK